MKIKKNNIPKAIDLLKGSLLKKTLTKAALLVHGDSVRLVPVLTGRLRASLNYKVESNSATVGTNVVYAGKIEFGGSKKAPNGYLRPALYKNESKILGFFNDMGKELEAL
jgi:hypothetical protein